MLMRLMLFLLICLSCLINFCLRIMIFVLLVLCLSSMMFFFLLLILLSIYMFMFVYCLFRKNLLLLFFDCLVILCLWLVMVWMMLVFLKLYILVLFFLMVFLRIWRRLLSIRSLSEWKRFMSSRFVFLYDLISFFCCFCLFFGRCILSLLRFSNRL